MSHEPRFTRKNALVKRAGLLYTSHYYCTFGPVLTLLFCLSPSLCVRETGPVVCGHSFSRDTVTQTESAIAKGERDFHLPALLLLLSDPSAHESSSPAVDTRQ